MVFDNPKFLEEVDKVAEYNCLQLIAEVRGTEEDKDISNKSITIVTDKVFPYLDMEMCWNKRDKLNLEVYLKSNQKLKYLNKESNHLP